MGNKRCMDSLDSFFCAIKRRGRKKIVTLKLFNVTSQKKYPERTSG